MVQSSNDVAMKDATTKFREEEYVSGMVQKSKEESCAPTKDAQTMPRKEGSVGDTEQRNICAVIKDVQTKPRRKGYV